MAPTMDGYQGRCHGEDEKVFAGLDKEKGGRVSGQAGLKRCQ